MINIKTIIVSLLNVTQVTDIVGTDKIFKSAPKDLGDYPCVVYSVIGGSGEYAFGRTKEITNFSIQLDLYNSNNALDQIRLTSLLSTIDDIMTQNGFIQSYIGDQNGILERIITRYSYVGIE